VFSVHENSLKERGGNKDREQVPWHESVRSGSGESRERGGNSDFLRKALESRREIENFLGDCPIAQTREGNWGRGQKGRNYSEDTRPREKKRTGLGGESGGS